ncbi:MAG: heme-binding Shp domain-containing protein [Blautia sp.]
MKNRLRKVMKFLCCFTGALAIAIASVPTVTAHADEIYPGQYTVEVVATYRNPVTGVVEDVGQNPSIGQMMVQAQVQSVGYVEIEEDGTIWLNTRWNQADANIYAQFDTSTSGDGDWVGRDYEVTNQVEVGDYEFMGNVYAATVTDYRFQLDSLNDVIRCTNYVEAMSRECIWFCYIQNLSEGVSDEWTNIAAPDMTSYTDSITQQLEEESGGDEETQDGGTNYIIEEEEASTSEPTATPTKKPETTKKAESSKKKESKTTPTIKKREVAEAKTASADDLLADSTGVEGAEDLDAEDKGDEGASVSTGTLVLAVIGGLILGGAVVGGIFYASKRKKKGYTDLFADVDDSDSSPKTLEKKDENSEK